MSFERQHTHEHAGHQAAQHDDDLAPGRKAASSHLVASSTPITSALIQRKARDANGVAEHADRAVANAAASSGHGLPGSVMRKFETSLGTELSGVRVHTGAASAHAAAAVSAKAYTVGQDIHFAAGQYDPSSTTGQHLLAHEVAHTVQQRGGTPRRQNKLEVSAPTDSFEHEADRAADAMVRGAPFSVGAGALAVSRSANDEHLTVGEQMGDEASYQEARVRAEAPPLVTQMSSIQTMSDVEAGKRKISEGNTHLFARLTFQQQQQTEAVYAEREEADAAVAKTRGYIDQNNATEQTLDDMSNLENGNSLLDEHEKPMAGHAMRLNAFRGLFISCQADFARLQGVVNVFLDAHPNVENKAGSDGGAALGRAVASGGKATDPNKATAKVTDHADPETAAALDAFKTAKNAYEGANYDELINEQVIACSQATGKLKIVIANQKFGTVRPDTDAQAKANTEVAAVQADLAAAKGAIDNVEAVVELATAAMGAPEIGVLGEGSAVTGAVNDVKGRYDSTVQNLSKPNQSRLAAAKHIGGAAGPIATATGIDVGNTIKDKIAHAMADYDNRISAAASKVAKANDDARKALAGFDAATLRNAQGDVTTAFNELAKRCSDHLVAKKRMREAAAAVVAAQKKHRKPGQPDIGAITQALSETTAFIETAKAAITQGQAEQVVAGKMMEDRKALVGDFKHDGKTQEMATDATRTQLAQKDWAIIDCEPSAPFDIISRPLSFSQWQGKDSNGREASTQTVDQTADEVYDNLQALNEYLVTAEAFKGPLNRALFGD